MNTSRKRPPALGTRRQLILEGARKASLLRSRIGVGPTAPIASIDAAILAGVEVRLVNSMTSMEGLYVKCPKPRILISSLRPSGRQAFTAAHELGHHVFGHDGHVLSNDTDEAESQVTERSDPNEILADSFAAHVLMPSLALKNALQVRKLNPETCTPLEIYRLAWYFGVGYQTIVRHLQLTLGFLTQAHAKALCRQAPKQLGERIIGEPNQHDVIPVDFFWNGKRPVDSVVGDTVVFPPSIRVASDDHTASVAAYKPNATIVAPKAPGMLHIIDTQSDWAIFMRVAPWEFNGLANYRFLPQVDEEDEHNA